MTFGKTFLNLSSHGGRYERECRKKEEVEYRIDIGYYHRNRVLDGRICPNFQVHVVSRCANSSFKKF